MRSVPENGTGRVYWDAIRTVGRSTVQRLPIYRNGFALREPPGSARCPDTQSPAS